MDTSIVATGDITVTNQIHAPIPTNVTSFAVIIPHYLALPAKSNKSDIGIGFNDLLAIHRPKLRSIDTKYMLVEISYALKPKGPISLLSL